MTDRATATLGVDLAAQAPNTGVCRIDWLSAGMGYVHAPGHGASDEDLITLMTRDDVTRVGIDAPFGWPTTFIDALIEYREAGHWPDGIGQDSHQRHMRLRATDRAVREATGLVPLSVSTDRIGVTAMRCARLLAAYQAITGVPIDRSGGQRLVEVYPAAALVQWNLSPKVDPVNPGSYKGPGPEAGARRRRLVDALAAEVAGWLEFPEKAVVVCGANDHYLDALLCALIARAVELHLVELVADPALAAAEGWIALPSKGLLTRFADGIQPH